MSVIGRGSEQEVLSEGAVRALLEEPADVLVVSVDRPLQEVVASILGGLHLTAEETQETL